MPPQNKVLVYRDTSFYGLVEDDESCSDYYELFVNKVTVNDKHIPLAKTLNCKSRNVIYLWQCKLCRKDDSYFGRTIQKAHKRTNTHRGCFNDPSKWEDSALLLHARNAHGENFHLKNFEISLIKKCSPQRIRREEFKYIDKFKTQIFRINRYKS